MELKNCNDILKSKGGNLDKWAAMDKETKTVKFENYDKNGNLSKYEITLDWSLDSILNIVVENENQKEKQGALFREDIDLD